MAGSKVSPMMQHYLSVKEEYKDCIIFYRLGDFYEMFFEDAKTVSKELELTLTGKDCGLEERAPMCGVPFHAADQYIRALVDLGYKVAICEQVEDPKTAKGLVERKVIRIVTPGTVTSSETLEETKNNYLFCVSYFGDDFGLAITDISTGKFLVTALNDINEVMDEIYKFQPSELLCQSEFIISGAPISEASEKIGFTISEAPRFYFDKAGCIDRIKRKFKVNSVEGLGLSDNKETIFAAGALLQYLSDTQMNTLDQISNIELYFRNDFMIIDSSTRRNLELCETMRDKKKTGSLLGVLDRTKTAMGARKLRDFTTMPLRNKSKIEARLDAISALNEDLISRDELREYLNSVYDLERLMTRISIKSANPRDMIMFRSSLQYLPYVKMIISGFKCELFRQLSEGFDELADIYEILDNAISDDAPLAFKEGGIFKDGFDPVIDDLRFKKNNSKILLAELEEREKEKTGIKGLKLKYNRVFGYYFDVTNSFKDLVPEYFIRKQTLANSERYTTAELNDLASDILGAEDKLNSLEYESFVALRDRLGEMIERVQKTADDIALIDALASLSYVAVKNHYVRPAINENGEIFIKNGRHPVVEQMTGDAFIPNDTKMDGIGNRIHIITGPNMAGKSTYMRQTALIALMAAMGSFVPADEADVCLCDRIFTRVGASDDLASGQSTFMVEMNEVANILRNATRNSLVILDEIGRGTSTFDGLAIAWAVVEYIAHMDILGCKTLFATHYHELTVLEERLSGVNNYSMAIKEDASSIVFLRKVVKGPADGSYGVDVASLAGVPGPVITRAREIADILEDKNLDGKIGTISDPVPVSKEADKGKKKKDSDAGQLTLFASPEEINIAAELRSMDLDNMTPMKAMLYLQELKNRLR